MKQNKHYVHSRHKNMQQGGIIVHPFPPGTKVETNMEYFKKFGRRVKGVSVAIEPLPPNELTFVRWEIQEGNIIPEHQNQVVLMLSKDLQLQTLN
jgi:hypothetical protein